MRVFNVDVLTVIDLFGRIRLATTVLVISTSISVPFLYHPGEAVLVARFDNAQFTVQRQLDGELQLTGNEVEAGLNVSLENIPDHLVQLIVASEDRHFFERPTLYLPARAAQALLGCLPRLVQYGDSVGCRGNSTITQQLIKLTAAAGRRGIPHKAHELVEAFLLEQSTTAESILTRYLNRVPLGQGAIGVEAAARLYFGKSVAELNLFDSAVIAGSVRRPSINVITDLEGSVARANLVLRTAYHHGYLPELLEMPEDYKPERGTRAFRKPYLKHIFQFAAPEVQRVTARLTDEPFKVTTTVNAELQVYTELALQEQVQQLTAKYQTAVQGAVVVMHKDGRVLSMVGGAGNSAGARNINRAVHTDGLYCAPAASTLKLVTYAAALKEGLRLDSQIDARGFDYQDGKGGVYSPRNINDEQFDSLTLQEAFARSSNTAAVNLVHERTGLHQWFATAEALGIPTDQFDRTLGVAIGQPEVCLLDLVSAYAAVVNDGVATRPQVLVEITDEGGLQIHEAERDAERVLPRHIAQDLQTLLQHAVSAGTSHAAGVGLDHLVIGGKTGTSDDHRDALFVGYVDDLVIGVLINTDTRVSLPGMTGGNAAAPVFNQLVRSVARYTHYLDAD